MGHCDASRKTLVELYDPRSPSDLVTFAVAWPRWAPVGSFTTGWMKCSVLVKPPRSWEPTGVRPPSENESLRTSAARVPVITRRSALVWTCDWAKSHDAGAASFASATPETLPFCCISIVPETSQSLRQAPPSWSVCCESTCIVRSHAVGAGWVGVGVSDWCAPGSSTPGGNGLERDATNAPTPAHAANTTTQIAILRGFGTRRGY